MKRFNFNLILLKVCILIFLIFTLFITILNASDVMMVRKPKAKTTEKVTEKEIEKPGSSMPVLVSAPVVVDVKSESENESKSKAQLQPEGVDIAKDILKIKNALMVLIDKSVEDEKNIEEFTLKVLKPYFDLNRKSATTTIETLFERESIEYNIFKDFLAKIRRLNDDPLKKFSKEFPCSVVPIDKETGYLSYTDENYIKYFFDKHNVKLENDNLQHWSGLHDNKINNTIAFENPTCTIDGVERNFTMDSDPIEIAKIFGFEEILNFEKRSLGFWDDSKQMAILRDGVITTTNKKNKNLKGKEFIGKLTVKKICPYDMEKRRIKKMLEEINQAIVSKDQKKLEQLLKNMSENIDGEKDKYWLSSKSKEVNSPSLLPPLELAFKSWSEEMTASKDSINLKFINTIIKAGGRLNDIYKFDVNYVNPKTGESLIVAAARSAATNSSPELVEELLSNEVYKRKLLANSETEKAIQVIKDKYDAMTVIKDKDLSTTIEFDYNLYSHLNKSLQLFDNFYSDHAKEKLAYERTRILENLKKTIKNGDRLEFDKQLKVINSDEFFIKDGWNKDILQSQLLPLSLNTWALASTAEEREKSVSIIASLIKAGVKIDELNDVISMLSSKGGYTLLHDALRFVSPYQKELVNAIINHPKCDDDYLNKLSTNDGDNVLMVTATSGNLENFKLLLEKSNNILLNTVGLNGENIVANIIYSNTTPHVRNEMLSALLDYSSKQKLSTRRLNLNLQVSAEKNKNSNKDVPLVKIIEGTSSIEPDSSLVEILLTHESSKEVVDVNSGLENNRSALSIVKEQIKETSKKGLSSRNAKYNEILELLENYYQQHPIKKIAYERGMLNNELTAAIVNRQAKNFEKLIGNLNKEETFTKDGWNKSKEQMEFLNNLLSISLKKWADEEVRNPNPYLDIINTLVNVISDPTFESLFLDTLSTVRGNQNETLLKSAIINDNTALVEKFFDTLKKCKKSIAVSNFIQDSKNDMIIASTQRNVSEKIIHQLLDNEMIVLNEILSDGSNVMEKIEERVLLTSKENVSQFTSWVNLEKNKKLKIELQTHKTERELLKQKLKLKQEEEQRLKQEQLARERQIALQKAEEERIRNEWITCTTSSQGLNFSNRSRDAKVSTEIVLENCKGHLYTLRKECNANISCSNSVPEKWIKCTTSSQGLDFSNRSRDAKVSTEIVLENCNGNLYALRKECNANIACKVDENQD
ncbi:MAG: hypothetical protein HQK51_11765 [Oligoflexia bacterium]|nr:hypothetical protein [Oligoflexia bacterium]